MLLLHLIRSELPLYPIQTIVAFFIGYRAVRFYNLSKEKVFLHLNIAFLLLGAGSLTYFLGSSMALLLTRYPKVLESGFVVSLLEGASLVLAVSEVLAYTSLALGYMRREVLASPLLLIACMMITSNLICLFLLIYIVMNLFIAYSKGKSRRTLTALLGFALMSLGHAFPMIPAFQLQLLGELLRTSGLVLILLSVR